MQLRLSHNVIKVRDLETMLDFYEGVLGFQVSDRGPIGKPGSLEIVFTTQVSSDHHQIAFFPVRTDEAESNNLEHMAFRVASLADVREMIERLGKDGRASDIGTVTHGNAWSVYFRDPEGNRIEVFCDTPWHVQQPEIVPWDPAMSDEELIEYTRNHFSSKPEFGPMEAWTAAQKQKFGEGA